MKTTLKENIRLLCILSTLIVPPIIFDLHLPGYFVVWILVVMLLVLPIAEDGAKEGARLFFTQMSMIAGFPLGFWFGISTLQFNSGWPLFLSLLMGLGLAISSFYFFDWALSTNKHKSNKNRPSN